VIVVVASGVDHEARLLVDEFPGGRAALLTPRDLSRPGWELGSASPRSWLSVVGGERIRAPDIEGVVTFLPCVLPNELVHIVEADREYVAAEMTAFLLYWLSGLPCRVLNRPTPGCLAGPSWRLERWCLLAAGIGIETVPCARSTRSALQAPQDADCVTASLVGGAVVGSEDKRVRSSLRRLAAAASVDLLTATFLREPGKLRLAGALATADASVPAVRRALVDCLSRRAAA
jgi:hypothetical protein